MKLVELGSLGSPGRTSSRISLAASKRSSSVARRCRAFDPGRGRSSKHLQSAALEGLVVTDIGIYPELEPALTERVYDEIAVGLLDFICARPDARSSAERAYVRSAPALILSGSFVTLPDPGWTVPDPVRCPASATLEAGMKRRPPRQDSTYAAWARGQAASRNEGLVR